MEASAADAVGLSPVTFLPVGVIGQPEQAVPPAAGVSGTHRPNREISPTSRVTSRRPRTSVARRHRDERSGVIGIDMAGGTTLRVDTTVDDEALHRVLTAIQLMLRFRRQAHFDRRGAMSSA